MTSDSRYATVGDGGERGAEMDSGLVFYGAVSKKRKRKKQWGKNAKMRANEMKP